MAQLIGQPFDATQVDPTQGQGQLPVGKHPVIAVSSTIDATKSGDGGMLIYILKITDGPYAGATGPYRLNLYNNSPKAVEIANRQLSALCHVTGVFQVADSDALLNIPFVVEVLPQADNPNYTEIKKVFDINGNEPGKPPTNQAQPQGQQQGQFQGGQQQQQGQFGGGQQQGQFNGGQQQQGQQQQFGGNQNNGGNFGGGQQQGNGQFGGGQQQQGNGQFGGNQQQGQFNGGNQQQDGNQQQQQFNGGGQQQQQQQGNGQQWAGNQNGGQQQQQQQQPQGQQQGGGAMPWGSRPQ